MSGRIAKSQVPMQSPSSLPPDVRRAIAMAKNAIRGELPLRSFHNRKQVSQATGHPFQHRPLGVPITNSKSARRIRSRLLASKLEFVGWWWKSTLHRSTSSKSTSRMSTTRRGHSSGSSADACALSLMRAWELKTAMRNNHREPGASHRVTVNPTKIARDSSTVIKGPVYAEEDPS